ncbi:hypothetical protein [Roseimaritima ulvae]|uniref:Tetratricopeptide repeat protein n=1 Tax=Roseimaritima ulvae TaxID=980254 RepID=A0A5B9QPD0_9BACT|nr:hypothetical protein [Roseimaritima ulvae]QEG39752.1 hypothetical protein UC8_17500 [Roseimaritima ulvae]
MDGRFMAGMSLCGVFVVLTASPAAAQQQVTVTAPLQRLNSGFSEQTGFRWSASGPNWSFRSGNLATVPFGQSSDRSMVGVAPSLTVTPGMPGHFFSGQVSPFVTGVRPVVGQSPAIAAAQLQQRQQWAASVEANAQRQTEKLRQCLQRGMRAEQEGDIKTARANYRRAMSWAAPPLRLQIQQHLQKMLAESRAAR